MISDVKEKSSPSLTCSLASQEGEGLCPGEGCVGLGGLDPGWGREMGGKKGSEGRCWLGAHPHALCPEHLEGGQPGNQTTRNQEEGEGPLDTRGALLGVQQHRALEHVWVWEKNKRVKGLMTGSVQSFLSIVRKGSITFINTLCLLDCGPSNVTLAETGLPWVPCVRGPGMCLSFMKRIQKRENSYWELAQRLLGRDSYFQKLL